MAYNDKRSADTRPLDATIRTAPHSREQAVDLFLGLGSRERSFTDEMQAAPGRGAGVSQVLRDQKHLAEPRQEPWTALFSTVIAAVIIALIFYPGDVWKVANWLWHHLVP